MANEYRRLDGAGVGLKPSEQDLTIAVTSIDAAAALTLGAGAVLAVVYLATASEPEIMEAMEHAKLRLIRHLSAT